MVYLKAKKQSYVLDEKQKPTEPAKLTEWMECDEQVQYAITSSLEMEQMAYIATCNTAAETWGKLRSIYEQSNGASKMMLLCKFYTYEMAENDTMAKHISNIEMMAKQLKDVGISMPKEAILSKLLLSLPSKYRHFLTAWDSVPEEDQTMEKSY